MYDGWLNTPSEVNPRLPDAMGWHVGSEKVNKSF